MQLERSVHTVIALFQKYILVATYLPVPVAARSKAWVWGRWLAGIAGFESRRGHGYLSVVSVVCCQVEVSATS